MKTAILTSMILLAGHVQEADLPSILPYASADGWNVLVDVDAGPRCYMLGIYDVGTVLRMMPQADDRSEILISNPRWKKEEVDREVSVIVSFAGGGQWRAPGRLGRESGMPTLHASFTETGFVADFVRGEEMSVSVDGRTVARTRPTGALAAMNLVEECQREVDAITHAPDGPPVETAHPKGLIA